MKMLIFFFIFLKVVSSSGQEVNPQYDSTLAKTLGADERGLKTYVLGILKKGSIDTQDKKLKENLFNGHLQNVRELYEKGLLVAAGGVDKNENTYRGIFILNVSSFEEANKLLASDPSIKENLFAVDLYLWHASAALPAYLKVHDKIAKFKP